MLSPLEVTLLNALKLKRATAWPFVPVERGGLGLPCDEENTTLAAQQARTAAADRAVDAAIAKAECYNMRTAK